jgi:hypothetical protein
MIGIHGSTGAVLPIPITEPNQPAVATFIGMAKER